MSQHGFRPYGDQKKKKPSRRKTPCRYCHKTGHKARDKNGTPICRKLIATLEKQGKSQTKATLEKQGKSQTKATLEKQGKSQTKATPKRTSGKKSRQSRRKGRAATKRKNVVKKEIQATESEQVRQEEAKEAELALQIDAVLKEEKRNGYEDWLTYERGVEAYIPSKEEILLAAGVYDLRKPVCYADLSIMD